MIKELENLLENIIDIIDINKNIINKNEDLINSKYLKIVKGLQVNIIKIKYSYEFIIEFLKYGKNKINLEKYKDYIKEEYLKYFVNSDIEVNPENFSFLNNQMKVKVIDKYKKYFKNFNFKKCKYLIREFKIKTQFISKMFPDGYLPINNDHRVSKLDFTNEIIHIKLYEDDKKMKKKSDLIKKFYITIMVYMYIYKNKFNLLQLGKFLLTENKEFLNKKSIVYPKFKPKYLSNFYDKLYKSSYVTYKKCFSIVRLKRDIYFPVNDKFYQADYIDFEKLDANYFNNNMDNLRLKINNYINENNLNIKNINLKIRPNNDNYFLVKLWTNIKNENLINSKIKKNVILHISGGGFIINLYNDSRYLLKKICDIENTILYSIFYRLTPKYCFPDPLNDILGFYFYILDIFKDKNVNIILLGDSAGGFLICSLINYLIILKQKLPNKIVILYPALETSKIYINKGLFKTFDRPFLSYSFLYQVRRHFFRNRNINYNINCLANPSYYYKFIIEKYPETVIFYADNDPFSYSCKIYYNILRENNINCKIYEMKSLYHGFLVLIQKIKYVRKVKIVWKIILKELSI